MLFTTVLLGMIAAAVAAPIDRRDSTTSNDLLDGPCRPLTVIFARGTSEPGNIGDDVGPYLLSSLSSIFGRDNIAFQGVDYPASIAGFLVGGSPQGAATLASLVGTANSQCPDTQIILSGYSQGAQVVYDGAAQLSIDQGNTISAAVLFGNPDDGKAVPNINNDNVITYCNAGDLICDGTVIVTPAHLQYAKDAPAAAAYIATKVSVN